MKKKFGQLMVAGAFVLAAAMPSPAPAEPRGGMAGGPSVTGGPSFHGQPGMRGMGGPGGMQMPGTSGPGAGPGMRGPQMHEMKGAGPRADHRMAMMGNSIFDGKVGPWQCEARLTDMRTHLANANAKSHHIDVLLTDPATKKPVDAGDGKGTVTVTGPDKKTEKFDLVAKDGRFGADVNLSKPGDYTFTTDIASGDKKGSTSFSYRVK